MSKILTRIRLINWHYFTNETINVKGSLLFSGENASGKSTILDAIQLVLTTNTRKFNPAANEKSKRDLKGYVRCKTGDEGNPYIRQGAVISYVALEFYEESKDKYFVIGVKLDSIDLDSDIKQKWFCVETSLDNINFIVNDKPALDDQFFKGDLKIQAIHTQKEAKDKFKRRLGNLDETFFELIPKSLAFKPMDDVKSFINKFILPERNIDVETLKENINSLKEMQDIVTQIKAQLNKLSLIMAKHKEIQDDEKDILINEVLTSLIELEIKKDILKNKNKEILENTSKISLVNNQKDNLEITINSLREEVEGINADIRNNECSIQIEKINNELDKLNIRKISEEKRKEQLGLQVKNILDCFEILIDKQTNITRKNVLDILSDLSTVEDNNKVALEISELLTTKRNYYHNENASINIKLENIKSNLVNLSSEIESLKKNQLIYPNNTLKLQEAIKNEFKNRSIDSEVRIFADLIEINDEKWQNAIEGYLNTQRFNIIVEPKYYDIAADVYNRLKDQIHSAGLVNTNSLELDKEIEENSLAKYIESSNRYSLAYARFLLGNIMCVEDIKDLKNYNSSITSTCMLYKNKVLRKINSEIYKNPYIGKYALKRQLEIRENQYKELSLEQTNLSEVLKTNKSNLNLLEKCNIELVISDLDCIPSLKDLKQREYELNLNLKEAMNNPTIISLNFKRDEIKNRIDSNEEKRSQFISDISGMETRNKENNEQIIKLGEEIKDIEVKINDVSLKDISVLDIAKGRLEARIRKNEISNKTIENLKTRKNTLTNKREEHLTSLVSLQSQYKEGELGTGLNVMSSYLQEQDRLGRHDLLMYEEKLAITKQNCEIEFRESFLTKMRENIENAESIFKDLNHALKDIYYGNDSYKFLCNASKQKQSLYNMIMSDINIGSGSLLSSYFEEEYKNEMDDLFSKLTQEDASNEKILNEYSDYRSYLDYDIEVKDREGKSQYFSKIYGEKSGGETQTPYYVAIAASFSQIYSYGETIKIIMMDEAFDKMDDDRIASMMEFFKKQGFQIIIATPPAKMEIIGQYVDTIYLAIRGGNSSTLLEYQL